MKILKLFTNLGVAASLAISSLPLPKLKEASAQQTSQRPYAVLVNGYQDCCVWSPKNQGYYMGEVAKELEAQGADIRRVPWDHFSDGKGQIGSLNDDKAFLDHAADYINNKLDPRQPLILIGHSYGGDSLLSLAPRINRKILFLGVIDPVAAGGFREPIQRRGVPSNVDYFLNRWQKNRLDGIPLINAKNVVPFDSALNGTVAGCSARVCDQQEQNLARNADGSEIRVDCKSLEVTCDGYQPWPGGSNGTKAQRLFHNPMPYDAYIQKQIVDRISSLLASYQPPITKEERIKQLYRQVLGREADPGGLSLHVNILKSGQQTLEQIRAGMASRHLRNINVCV